MSNLHWSESGNWKTVISAIWKLNSELIKLIFCHGCSKDMQSFIIFKSVWSESKKTLFFTFRRDGLVFQEDYSFSTEDIPMEGEKIKSRNEWHRVTLTQIEDEDEFRILIFFDSENIVDEPNDSPQTWSNSLIQSFNKSDSFLLNNLFFYTN